MWSFFANIAEQNAGLALISGAMLALGLTIHQLYQDQKEGRQELVELLERVLKESAERDRPIEKLNASVEALIKVLAGYNG